MFDSIAPHYDLMNDVLSLGQDVYWRRQTAAALQVESGERVLDVAAGTGTSTDPLARSGGEVWALDRSPGMVEVGRAAHPEAWFIVGDAHAMPFADATFDVVTISFGLRNMQRPQDVLAELARVTRPGGRLVICEFSQPQGGLLKMAHSVWLNRVIPLADRLFDTPDNYRYLTESIVDWPDPKVVASWMRKAGWADVAVKRLTGGIVALHRGVRV